MVPVTGGVGVGGCALITTLDEDAEVHPSALLTVNVYVPAARPETVVLVPVPLVVAPPGLRVNVHVPDEGNPPSTTLPVATVQVGCVLVPTVGADGMEFTVRVYVAEAAVHGDPKGLLVVTVMITVFPASPEAGVYVNENGEVFVDVGLTDPAPFSVMLTLVALPPNVFPLTVTAFVPQVLPEELLNETVGGVTQPQDTEKLLPVVVHPAAFFTVIV